MNKSGQKGAVNNYTAIMRLALKIKFYPHRSQIWTKILTSRLQGNLLLALTKIEAINPRGARSARKKVKATKIVTLIAIRARNPRKLKIDLK